MPTENLWRVDIVNADSAQADANGETNKEDNRAIWHSINSQVQLTISLLQPEIYVFYVNAFGIQFK